MNRKKTYITLLICTLGSVGLVTLLFALSDTGLERDNSIVRRFLAEPPKKIHELDIGYNSYYIAGATEGKIYLGNVTAPLHLMILDTTLRKKRTVTLRLDKDSIAARAIQLRVAPPYFFLMDGTVPYILRGNTMDWKARSLVEKKPFYFSSIQPMDSVSFAIRTVDSQTKKFILGKLNVSDTASVSLSDKLLQKQVDGIFDTDGMLLYNDQIQRLVYIYFYRNQYIVADNDLRLDRFGKTIDTISRAQVQVGTIASKNQRQLSAPAQVINRYSATYGKHLFVNSKLPGRLEPIEMWNQASVIDVYDLTKNIYQFSFYVDDIDQDKLKKFKVLNDKFIGLIGNHIVVYQLDKERFTEMYTNHATALGPNIISAMDQP